MMKRRRVRLFIARRFQIRYIAMILFFMFVISLVTGYTVYMTTWIMFGEKLAAVYPQGLLREIAQKVNMVLILRLIFITPLVILIGLVLSNRIAGPIYRIKRYLKKVSLGKYGKRLELRKKDELHDLAEEINVLVSNLDSEEKQRKEEVDTLKREIDSLKSDVVEKEKDVKQLLSRISTINEHLDTLKKL